MKKPIFLLLASGYIWCSNVNASFTEPVSKLSKDSISTTSTVMDDAVVTDALHQFRSLTRVERKMRLQEAKKLLKEYKEEKKAGNEPSTNTVLLAILAILLPPLAVYLKEGTINGKFWLSVLLTLLFWLPGVIYALIVVLG